MKKHRTILLSVAMLMIFSIYPAFASEPEEQTRLYPAEVTQIEENGINYIQKIYHLKNGEDPAAIPDDAFVRDGYKYELIEVLKNELVETDAKMHEEAVERDSYTDDMTEIVKALEPEIHVETEDGYLGRLALDYASIEVSPKDYKTSSYTVKDERTYPNLSDEDLSYVPKTVEKNGRTLKLTDVKWQDSQSDYVDGYDIPMRYTAIATYTTTVASKTPSNYAVTASYKGEVTKTVCDTIAYTAIFQGHNVITAGEILNYWWAVLILIALTAAGVFVGRRFFAKENGASFTDEI